MTPRYVVASTGRSGSGWIAKVLTDCGLACGHERWWNPFGVRDHTLLGDSSWMAAFDLDDFDGLVVHQVRHPLDVVRSLVGGWSKVDEYAPHRLAHLEPSGDDLVDAMRIVLGWNEQIAEHADTTWRVEDVEALHVAWLGNAIGEPVAIATAERALAATPRTYNRHQSRRGLTWADLPDVPELGALLALAAFHGYEVEP